MSLSAANDQEFYAPLSGVGSDISPQVYAKALGSSSWSVAEFNYYMQLMYYRILSWDQAGWYYPTAGQRACWRTHPNDYSRWRTFMARFSSFFKKGFSYYYVSGANEKTARNFLIELRRWGNWFDAQCAPAAGVAGLGDFGVIPVLFYVAGATAVAATATIASWLSKPEWSAGEYNHYMRQMFDTIILWQNLGWKGGDKACWRRNPARYEMWQAFMREFQKHYHDHGIISAPFNPNEGDIVPARNMLAALARWGEWLQNVCGSDIETPDAPPAPQGFDYGEALKWGAILTLGVVGLNVIKGVRDVFPNR